jgi:hypothetical protein
MPAQVIPMVRVCEDACQSDWRIALTGFPEYPSGRDGKGLPHGRLGTHHRSDPGQQIRDLGRAGAGICTEALCGHLLEQES